MCGLIALLIEMHNELVKNTHFWSEAGATPVKPCARANCYVPVVFNVCDEITVMDSGCVIAAGDPDRMYRDPAVREANLGASNTSAQPG